MSFYLSNNDTQPTGFEPAEFLDLPTMAEVEIRTVVLDHARSAPAGPPPTATRTYIGTGITVHWDSDRCIHAERCTSGAPSVFDRSARPWVHPDGAPADEIAAVIDTCPSGALSYSRTDGSPNGRRGRGLGDDPAASTAPDPELAFYADDRAERAADEVPVTITPQHNGPLVVEGAVRLVRPDGSVEDAGRLALCRCGQSGSKPNCDGTHSRVGFQAPGVAG
jgi:uncharacterized Fe-S cluster protein YjdI